MDFSIHSTYTLQYLACMAATSSAKLLVLGSLGRPAGRMPTVPPPDLEVGFELKSDQESKNNLVVVWNHFLPFLRKLWLSG